MVRQPRIPCYKLAAKFQRNDILARFLRSARSGFYFSVEQEGSVATGDSFEFLNREPEAITIAEMNRLYVEEKYNRDLLGKAIATPALPEDWREYLRKRSRACDGRELRNADPVSGVSSLAPLRKNGDFHNDSLQFCLSMILDALHRIANHGQSLDRAEAREVMSEVLAGQCTDAQIAALLDRTAHEGRNGRGNRRLRRSDPRGRGAASDRALRRRTRSQSAERDAMLCAATNPWSTPAAPAATPAAPSIFPPRRRS